MPFKSRKQMKFMFSQHPDIAKRWVKEAKSSGHPFIEKSKKTTDGRKHTRKVLKRYGFDYKTR